MVMQLSCYRQKHGTLATTTYRFLSILPYAPHEDTQHILLCSHMDSIDTWDKALSNLLYKLHFFDTCPQILIALSNELNSWRRQQSPPDLQNLPKKLRTVILFQRSIGWKQLLEGLVTTSWSDYMNTYYRKSNSLKTGNT